MTAMLQDKQMQERIKAMQEDPEMADMFKEIRAGGMQVRGRVHARKE